MKRKRIAEFVAGLCIAACVFTGCGKEEEGGTETVPAIAEDVSIADTSSTVEEETEETEPEPVPEPETTITDRVVVDGKMQSYLTGEWKDEAVVKRRSMAVMMPNNKKALPQYGISRASIIYEAPVEGRMTRLMAFYEDYDDLDMIGPVRSSRDYYVYEAMAYDAIYCNWGLAVPYVKDLINSDRIDNISQAVLGIDKPYANAFMTRTRPKRSDGSSYAQEYTGYLSVSGYENGVKKLGYEPEYRDSFVQAFTFAADGYPATYDDHMEATLIYPGGKKSNSGGYGDAKPYFEYHKEDGLYYRYQFGDKHIDEMNDEQLAVSNVVFKICHGEVRDDHDYLAFGVHGSGEAYIFTAGKVIKGTWTRTGSPDPEVNMFYDENGNEIIFNQGKTWICNIWDKYLEYMMYE